MLPVIGEIRPWADPTVLQLNRLAMHVPMSGFHRCSLDGHWSLELFDSPDAVPAEALEGERPRAATVAAPGNWTVQYLSSPCGPAFVDTPHYTNTQMPFGGPPPRVPVRNPTGVYRRPFTVPAGWMQRRAVLHISGAESLHAGYVNGRFVGYGTDSRLPSEYDVGPFLVARPQRAGDRGRAVQRPQLHRGPRPTTAALAARIASTAARPPLHTAPISP